MGTNEPFKALYREEECSGDLWSLLGPNEGRILEGHGDVHTCVED